MPKSKTKSPPETKLYPGETNTLMSLSEILSHTLGLIREEIDRLEKLRGNSTFPNEHYQKHVRTIRNNAKSLHEITAEVKP